MIVRKILAVLLGLFAALMLYDAMTIPYIAATTPAILGVASAAAAYFMWPKREHVTPAASSESEMRARPSWWR